MKISVFIATSLDGFIARLDGDIDWLTDPDNKDNKEDYGYLEFAESVDFIVMGRNSFEKVLSFGIDWPYDKPVIILSKTIKAIPENLIGKVEIFSYTIEKLVLRLRAANCNRVYIDGGKVIQSFLKLGYVTDLTLTRIPILIGTGIPLFGTLDEDIKLKHVETKSYSTGLVQSIYEV